MENLKSLKSAVSETRRKYIAALREFDAIPDRRESEKETALLALRLADRDFKDARGKVTRFLNAASAVNAPRVK